MIGGKKNGNICLGIESTAHTFGVGIVDSDGNVLADVRDMFRPEPGKGMIPREASEHHTERGIEIIRDALNQAGLTLENIDVIAFAQGPGLPPCLKVGGVIARYLAMTKKKDLIGVNHPVAHIEIGRLTTGVDDPVILFLSGGNTQVIAFAEGFYRIFGETVDVPVGNAFDVIARELKLKSPGGPEIEKLASGGSYIELPYSVKGMDMSFSGIITESRKNIRNGAKPEDVCHSLQETCFSMLTEVCERALAHTEKNEVLLVGGVAANKRLQDMVKRMCDDRGSDFHVVEFKYSGDCGAMIAWTGMLAYKSGLKTPIKNSNTIQKWRTDETKIEWM